MDTFRKTKKDVLDKTSSMTRSRKELQREKGHLRKPNRTEPAADASHARHTEPQRVKIDSVVRAPIFTFLTRRHTGSPSKCSKAGANKAYRLEKATPSSMQKIHGIYQKKTKKKSK